MRWETGIQEREATIGAAFLSFLSAHHAPCPWNEPIICPMYFHPTLPHHSTLQARPCPLPKALIDIAHHLARPWITNAFV